MDGKQTGADPGSQVGLPRGRDSPRHRFAAGDPLRAIAALTVLAYHCALTATLTFDHDRMVAAYGSGLGEALGALNGGLFLFFALSGYLISAPFIAAFVGFDPNRDLRGYVRARLLRIVPAYWAVLTVVALLYLGGDGSIGSWAAAYGFAVDYEPSTVTLKLGQSWTLAVELAFYALVPIAAVIAARVGRAWSRSGRIRFVLGASVAVAAISLTLREVAPDTLLWRRSAPLMLAAFVPGVLLALLEAADPPWRNRLARRPLPLLAALAGLVMFYAASRVGSGRVADSGGGLALALSSCGAGLVVGACLAREWPGQAAHRALDNPVLRWIGERSYSVYLVHVVIVFELSPHWAGSPEERLVVLVAATVPLTMLAAAIGYRCVERPFLRLRHASPRAAEVMPETQRA